MWKWSLYLVSQPHQSLPPPPDVFPLPLSVSLSFSFNSVLSTLIQLSIPISVFFSLFNSLSCPPNCLSLSLPRRLCTCLGGFSQLTGDVVRYPCRPFARHFLSPFPSSLVTGTSWLVHRMAPRCTCRRTTFQATFRNVFSVGMTTCGPGIYSPAHTHCTYTLHSTHLLQAFHIHAKNVGQFLIAKFLIKVLLVSKHFCTFFDSYIMSALRRWEMALFVEVFL